MPYRLCPECDTRTPEEVCPGCGTRTVAEVTGVQASSDPLIGLLVEGRYRIEGFVGRGGMGTVYRAVHIAMNKVVALKVLKAESAMDVDAVKRFHREARAASLLSHPHTVRVFDFGQSENGDLFMAMEYLEGRTLARMMCAEGRFTVARTLKIICEIAQSLGEAHNSGVVHRDLKPENIDLVDVFGDPDFVKILDFGIARFQIRTLESSVTEAGMVLGTPQYMAPEQALPRTPVTSAADIYSLGIIMFEMLSGNLPFDDESPLQVMMAHQNSPVPDLPPRCPAPPEMVDLMHRMLAKDPRARPTAAEVVEFCSALRLRITSGMGVLRPRTAEIQPLGPAIEPVRKPPPAGQIRQTEPGTGTGTETYIPPPIETFPEVSPASPPSLRAEAGPLLPVQPVPKGEEDAPGVAPSVPAGTRPAEPPAPEVPALGVSRRPIWIAIVLVVIGVVGAAAFVAARFHFRDRPHRDSVAVDQADVQPAAALAPDVESSTGPEGAETEMPGTVVEETPPSRLSPLPPKPRIRHFPGPAKKPQPAQKGRQSDQSRLHENLHREIPED